jgi:GH25 family lysozyme M1 (1,4-beta-N-acetylmuramidase)
MLLKQIEGMNLELPIVFDWENFSHFQQYGISFQQLNHLYDVFEEEVTAAGYDSMLYGSKYYLQAVWAHTDTRPVWLAHFTSQTNYEGPYKIWQASATGQVPGIDAYVDMNILYD